MKQLAAVVAAGMIIGAVAAAQQKQPTPATPAAPKAKRVRAESFTPVSVTAHEGLTYATYGERQLKLDLYLPKWANKEAPAVIFVHGGGWFQGDRASMRPLAQQLAALGFATATIEYRLAGEATFPAALNDLKAAVRWMRNNGSSYLFNGRRIGAVGGSAGGHLVGLLAVTGNEKRFEGDGGNPGVSSAIAAAVVMAGPMDLTSPEALAASQNDPRRRAINFLGATWQENPQVYRDASPVYYIDRRTPPVLFIDGEHDDPGPRSESMRAKLEALGIDTGLIVMPNAPHAYWGVHPWFEPTLEHLHRFFTEHLEAGE